MTYVSVSDVDQFADVFGDTWVGSQQAKEQALARAQAYLDNLKWNGQKTGGREQEEAWPRKGVTDADGFEVPDDEIPHEIKYALSVLAVVELASAGLLTPNITLNRITISEKVGEIAVAYSKTAGVDSARVIVTRALDAIKPFLAGSTMFLQRA